MNYQKIYDALMQRAAHRPRPDCYVERHHIVPVALGGSNSESNLVHLTCREHFIAHNLLTRITSGSDRHKMISAFAYMAFTRHNKCLQRRCSSRDYELARVLWRQRRHTEERNKRISASRRKLFASGYVQIRSTETKMRHRATLARKKAAGITMPEHQREAIGKGLIGNKNGANHVVTKEHKAIIAQTQSKEYVVTSPTGDVTTITNLSEWLRRMNCRTRKIGCVYAKGPLKGWCITAVA